MMTEEKKVDPWELPRDENDPDWNKDVDIRGWITDINPNDKLVADPESGAMKADGNKLRFDLMPVYPLEELTKVLTYGSLKYADRNWEQGMKWSRPFSATMRHLWAWWRGEDVDADTGISHLAHAACNIFFLLEFERTKRQYDDRPGTNS